MILMHVLKKIGVMQKLNDLMEPGLRFLGMSKNAAPVTIIGMTLGLSYGGGLIIKEAKEKMLNKKDAFLSLCLMGLSHSLIEDTFLMIAIGANLIGILGARIIFTIVVMFVLIKFIKHISKNSFQKFFAR
jgi:spore maturation protein SpmB